MNLPEDVPVLDALCAWLDGPRDFIAVDLRDDPSAAIWHRRTWARGGWRASPLSVETIWETVALSGLPVAILIDPSTRVPDAATGLPRSIFVRCAASGMTVGGRDLHDVEAPLDASGTTRIVLHAARQETLTDRDLPLELRVLRQPANELPTFGVEIHPLDPRDAPPVAWFRLPRADRDRDCLVVDIDARIGGDRWRVSAGPPGGGTHPLRPVPAPAPSHVTEEFQHLAVIFDRTCPDRDRWSAARAAVLGRGAIEADPFGPQRAENLDKRDFNLEIRNAVAAALEESCGGMLVDAWTVADVASDGMAWPTGVEGIGRAIVPTGTAGAGQFADLFAAAGWSPGLDLWDPVEEALSAALDKLHADRVLRGAVLIVGDSPPTPLLGRICAFQGVTRALGPETSVRRQSADWTTQLRRAERLRIPVVWLFLEGHRAATEDASSLERCRAVQDQVRSALAGCVRLVAADADREGILAGVPAALARLASSRSSGVTLDADPE